MSYLSSPGSISDDDLLNMLHVHLLRDDDAILNTQPPSFEMSDVTNATMIGRGAFGKVFKVLFMGKAAVMKTTDMKRPTKRVHG
jgi:hypothetical protein